MSHWSQINPKVFSTILRFQLNYHDLPVSPFKGNIGIKKITSVASYD